MNINLLLNPTSTSPNSSNSLFPFIPRTITNPIVSNSNNRFEWEEEKRVSKKRKISQDVVDPLSQTAEQGAALSVLGFKDTLTQMMHHLSIKDVCNLSLVSKKTYAALKNALIPRHILPKAMHCVFDSTLEKIKKWGDIFTNIVEFKRSWNLSIAVDKIANIFKRSLKSGIRSNKKEVQKGNVYNIDQNYIGHIGFDNNGQAKVIEKTSQFHFDRNFLIIFGIKIMNTNSNLPPPPENTTPFMIKLPYRQKNEASQTRIEQKQEEASQADVGEKSEEGYLSVGNPKIYGQGQFTFRDIWNKVQTVWVTSKKVEIYISGNLSSHVYEPNSKNLETFLKLNKILDYICSVLYDTFNEITSEALNKNANLNKKNLMIYNKTNALESQILKLDELKRIFKEQKSTIAMREIQKKPTTQLKSSLETLQKHIQKLELKIKESMKEIEAAQKINNEEIIDTKTEQPFKKMRK